VCSHPPSRQPRAYAYAEPTEKSLCKLLTFLSEGSFVERLETCQATGKLIGDILYFSSCFDEAKMNNSSMQNDFSYYRRTLAKRKMSPSTAGQGAVPVDEDLTNSMSFFFANATPMTKAIIDGASSLSSPVVIDLFAVICGLCYHAITKKRVGGPLVDFCKRTMVTAIVVFDNLHPIGAFSKDSAVPMKEVVAIIKEGEEWQGLFNTLKFSTAHLNDESTPKELKKLFQ
jgi:hypothetical protein